MKINHVSGMTLNNACYKNYKNNSVSFKSKNEMQDLKEETAKLSSAMEKLAQSQADLNKYLLEKDKNAEIKNNPGHNQPNSKGAFYLNNSTNGMYGIANANDISEAQVIKGGNKKIQLHFTFNTGKQAVFELSPTIVEKDANGKILINGSNLTEDEKVKYYADRIKDVMSGKSDSFEINLINARPLMMPHPTHTKDEITNLKQKLRDEEANKADFYKNAALYFSAQNASK